MRDDPGKWRPPSSGAANTQSRESGGSGPGIETWSGVVPKAGAIQIVVWPEARTFRDSISLVE